MPKSRKSRRRGPGRTPRQVTIPRLVEEFAASREAAGQDGDDAWVLQPLAELKRDLLDSPDPTVWRSDELAELLLDVVPRKIHLDADDRDLLVPTLADFFAFLEAGGRWSARSTPRAELVADLAQHEPAIRAALADPGRRSMGGNIIDFALSQGLDVSDDASLGKVMEMFNALSYEERAAVTETGRLPGAAAPGGTGAGGDHAGAAFGLAPDGRPRLSVVPDLDEPDWPEGEDPDDVELADIWPGFLGDPLDPDYEPPALSASEQAAALAGTELVRRADLLLDWLGTGKKVTSTGALRQADTAEVVRLLGLDPPPVRSMWDVPELTLLWAALITGGFVDVGRTTVRPATEAAPWEPHGGLADRRVEAGTVLLTAALTAFLALQEDGTTMAHMAPMTFLALTKATQPGGVHLAPDGHDDDVLALLVHADLVALAAAGVLSVSDDRYTLVPQLLPMLDVVMHQVLESLAAR
ncbi:hypothetical protein [Georgenia subflava]|uniref:Uncharacterized protein n=1 Tax=Georgenia subflava TaxID=1622177 RepID=A0A6N7EHI1_9MICO|nr:hypothetical protein [Georgenia subflava]MPV35606.1 hypothetical protein [Georgenia subflava]